jgi:hypothetical protein
MNPNARKRLTDATLIALAARLVESGYRYTEGPVTVRISRGMADDIYALAYDRSKHIARKARLDQAVTA